jgi:hypothetical protein
MKVQSIGVTTAVRASEYAAMGRDEAKSWTKDAFRYLEVELRAYTGDATPVGAPTFQIDGPHDDPLQGMIMVMSVAAPYDVDTLPVTCKAYETHNQQRQAAERGLDDQGGSTP